MQINTNTNTNENTNTTWTLNIGQNIYDLFHLKFKENLIMKLWINVHIIYGGSRIFQTTGINTAWCILAIGRPQGPRLA